MSMNCTLAGDKLQIYLGTAPHSRSLGFKPLTEPTLMVCLPAFFGSMHGTLEMGRSRRHKPGTELRI